MFGEYVDAGFSGKSMDRPEMNRLMKDAGARQFDVVVAHSVDRSGRDIIDVMTFVFRHLPDLGIDFETVMDGEEFSSSTGKLMMMAKSWAAEEGRERIVERQNLGKRTKAAQGIVVQKWLPFGYMKGTDKKWTVCDPERVTYDFMVRLYLSGSSTKEIANRLTATGIPTKRGWNVAWSKGAVKKILKNPVYLGHHSYCGVSFKIPALIDEKSWQSLQRKLIERRSWRNQRVRHFYLLRGLLICRCGRSYFGVHKDKKHRAGYHCYSRKSEHGESCGVPPLPMEIADLWAWKMVRDLIARPTSVQKIIHSGDGGEVSTAKTLEDEMSNLEAGIRKRSAERKRLLELYAEETISRTELTELLVAQDQKIETLQTQIDSISRQLGDIAFARANRKGVEDFLRTFRAKIVCLSDQQKQQIISKLVERIIVNYDADGNQHHLMITYKFRLPDSEPSTMPVLAPDCEAQIELATG